MTEEDKSRVEPNAEERSDEPLGNQQEKEPRSVPTEDEDRYTVRLTIHPALVPGLTPSDRGISADMRKENHVREELQEEWNSLREDFQERAEKADLPESGIWFSQPKVRFTLRELHTDKGSITLIAILGAVYVGAKDYDTLRKSLLLLAEDMKILLRAHLAPVLPRWWTIDSKVMIGTRTPLPQPTGASERGADAPTAPAQPGRRGFDWDAKMMFILYLAITNVAVILFLGFLLVRASS